MTKFILTGGGYPDKAKDKGKALCLEATEGFVEPINILICLFAREKDLWPELFEEYKNLFIGNLPNKKLTFQLASIKNFITQIIRSNVIFISGGDTRTLFENLKLVPSWHKFLNNKVVVGSSASTDLLSKYNYDLEYFKCLETTEGLGLVPVKTLVHYRAKDQTPPEGWEKAYQELKNYKEDLPIWTLREGEYKVYINN